jgi:hypothetical protein
MTKLSSIRNTASTISQDTNNEEVKSLATLIVEMCKVLEDHEVQIRRGVAESRRSGK